MSDPASIVIVGAGLAAANTVEGLRDEGYDGALSVVGAEPHPPYERPPLTKSFLSGAKPIGVVYPHDEGWYTGKRVELLKGTTAVSLDPASQQIQLDSGRTLEYDAVLLATGASPRVPDLPGADSASYLRTIEDSQKLKTLFEKGGRLAIVGGGWIGLEAAAAARGYDVEVTVLEMDDLPLHKVLGDELARYLADLHSKHGVDLRTGVKVSRITSEGVETADGVVPADVVLVAVGAAPNTELAESAGLSLARRELGGGILVDEHLRASAPGVFAAGDVANARNTLLDAHVRVEHWDNAIRQGKLAARSMLGLEGAYDWQPYFYTDQFEFGMEYVGHGSPDDEVVIRGDKESGEFIAYWLSPTESGDRVTAAMNVNIWDVNDELRKIVGTTVDRRDLTDLR